MSEYGDIAILEPNSEPNLAMRLEAIAVKLGTERPHYIIHRLPDAEHLYSQLEARPSTLTYGQIVQRYETNESPDLPLSAVRCIDPDVECTLMEGHLDEIDNPRFRGRFPDHPLRLAGFKVNQLQHVANEFGLDISRASRPTIEGYQWFCAYVIKTTRSSTAILLRPWMQNEREQGSPFPVMYTIGNPKLSDIRNIAAEYINRETITEEDESLTRLVIRSLAKGIWKRLTDKSLNST